ncbi:MAG: recombination regulator RecX [Alphaproteobacteria bacterium]|jgi:regulatory protein|nr:recombination regulator RecX [Alphaproteobacteria bacterium]
MNKTRNKKPKKITPRYLENYALYYLERFSSSSENLRRVIMTKIIRSCKFYEDDNIEEKKEWLNELIDKLQRIGYLNDEMYTNMKARSLRYSGNSKRKIAYKLRQKGLSEEMINKSIQKADKDLYDSDEGELETAIKYAKKKRIGRFRTKEINEKTKEKELSSMARAGFSYDIAKKALEEE